jgi:peptide/nickel transport system permease protein
VKALGLRTYIAKRIVYSIALVFFVITVNFVIFMLMPGNPAMRLADSMRIRNPDVVKAVTEAFGLNDPMHVRYAKYVRNMLTGQFGTSYYTNKPVSDEIIVRLQNTLILVVPPEIIATVIGIVLGVIAAYKRGQLYDSIAVVTSLAIYSLPVFWIAMMLISVFSLNLNWLPSAYSQPDYWFMYPPSNILVDWTTRLRHLVLPWATLILLSYGSYLLLTRATMLEAITEDYVVTARAKGLKERTVLFKHTLKNASLPIITDIAITFGFMLSGAIITEQVFIYPGLGWWIWRSIDELDYPALQAIFFIIALCVIAANFIADLLYGVIDPRIKYG